MYKLCLFCLLFFAMISCGDRDIIDKKTLESISEVNIQNRTTDNFGGIEEYRIKDKKEITSICKELFSLEQEHDSPTKPYDGTIVIEFLTKDKDGAKEYINILSTRIILKPQGEYFITNSRGQYVSDHFLSRILKYLQIDEKKVSGLNGYRKTKESLTNEKQKDFN